MKHRINVKWPKNKRLRETFQPPSRTVFFGPWPANDPFSPVSRVFEKDDNLYYTDKDFQEIRDSLTDVLRREVSNMAQGKYEALVVKNDVKGDGDKKDEDEEHEKKNEAKKVNKVPQTRVNSAKKKQNKTFNIAKYWTDGIAEWKRKQKPELICDEDIIIIDDSD